MPQPGSVQDVSTLTIANGQTTSDSALVDNPGEIGLFVPTITAATITVQVSEDNSNFFGLVNQAGTPILVTASGTGSFAISGNEMGAILAYKYVRVVSSGAQGAQRLFTLKRKWTGHQRVG